MQLDKQEAPYCIQIELALGCNLQCSFCGLNGIQERPNHNIKSMTLETAEIVAKRIAESGWNPRLEFARRGEPTMNPDAVEIIRIFRKYNPKLQIMITSNGGGLLRKPGIMPNIRAFFEAGLNILALDDYESVRIVPKVREAMRGVNDLKVYEYPDEPDGNPHRRHKPGTQFVTLLRDISIAVKGVHSKLNNHAGHGADINMNFNKPCAKPFREIGINWDGTIDICCIDWASEYRIGSLVDNSLEEIWQSEKFQAARLYLIRGQRHQMRPCRGCDHPSYRTGLLPDKLGKVKLPEPNAESDAITKATEAVGPTIPVTDIARKRIGSVVAPAAREAWGLEVNE